MSRAADEPAVDRSTDESPAGLDHVEAAIREVRREGRKVAVVYAVLDAVLVLLAANLFLAHLGPEIVTGRVELPPTVAAPVADALGRGGDPVALATSAILAVGIGLVAFAVEYAIRVRRPIVEQFEAANPDLRVALRTARDAAGADSETQMARRLYEDVLDRLRSASSARLLDTVRIAATMIAIVGLSLLTVQTAAVDLDLVRLDDAGPDGTDGPDTATDYEGLQDGDSVLGEPETVDAGNEELSADIGSSGGDRDADTERVGGYDPDDPAGTGEIESQQSGYAPTEAIEDAELVREYNLKIRDEE